MADHELVDQVINWLDTNWDSTNAAKPTLIDRDDADSASFNQRTVSHDLTDNHSISVASTPERITEPIGTEYDHRIEDAVNCRVEGAHTDEFGTISDAGEFQTIIDEAERSILVERTVMPVINSIDYHTVKIENGRNQSSDHKDYFRYDVDVVFVGYKTLP